VAGLQQIVATSLYFIKTGRLLSGKSIEAAQAKRSTCMKTCKKGRTIDKDTGSGRQVGFLD
jgi:hypothetical protein